MSASGRGDRPVASAERAALVARGARSGAALGAVGGLVSGLAVLALTPSTGDALLVVLAPVLLSAAVGAATGALGGRLVAAQVESGNGVRPVPVLVVCALVAVVLLLLVSALLQNLAVGPVLAGAGAVLGLVRVAGLARAARTRGPLPPVV
ncbi:hypothetical protein WDZ17_02310 [Pseudokineococcus basanitobsidens]|uniref:Uncharacterized protein n=1 Tax=Pseudokineococcus basanitobsidens TaxID=1926649 RepID=A0ABU8RGD8_9ACTN